MGFIYRYIRPTSDYFCHVRRSVTQSIPDAVVTRVEYDSTVYDPTSMYDFVNDRIVIPKTGTWLLSMASSFDFNAVGVRQIRIHLAGTSLISLNSWAVNQTAGEEVYGSTSHIRRLTAGDFISGHVYQNSTGALDVSIGTPRDILQAVLLHV